jgi:hypothetical protein
VVRPLASSQVAEAKVRLTPALNLPAAHYTLRVGVQEQHLGRLAGGTSNRGDCLVGVFAGLTPQLQPESAAGRYTARMSRGGAASA